jgi:hypothetical protein
LAVPGVAPDDVVGDTVDVAFVAERCVDDVALDGKRRTLELGSIQFYNFN